MKAAADLSAVGAGFSDLALGSQSVFRAALEALSHPGRIVAMQHDAQVPSRGHAASAALLLALLDPDCRLWLSPSLAGSDAAAWLRFHSGCTLVADPGEAQFAWIASGDQVPDLEHFAQGSDFAPEHSTTCVVDVLSLEGSLADTAGHKDWVLRGPGMRTQTRLRVQGLPGGMAPQLAAQRGSFPRGVDLFLATQHQIVGLPRTTSIERRD